MRGAGEWVGPSNVTSGPRVAAALRPRTRMAGLILRVNRSRSVAPMPPIGWDGPPVRDTLRRKPRRPISRCWTSSRIPRAPRFHAALVVCSRPTQTAAPISRPHGARRAAEVGASEDQGLLSHILSCGPGTIRDQNATRSWFRRDAAAGWLHGDLGYLAPRRGSGRRHGQARRPRAACFSARGTGMVS